MDLVVWALISLNTKHNFNTKQLQQPVAVGVVLDILIFDKSYVLVGPHITLTLFAHMMPRYLSHNNSLTYADKLLTAVKRAMMKIDMNWYKNHIAKRTIDII